MRNKNSVVSLPSDIYALLNYSYPHANATHHPKNPYYLAVLTSQKLNLSPQPRHKCANLYSRAHTVETNPIILTV